VRGDFTERDEDECALGEARVGDLKAGGGEDEVVKEEDVEVESSGAILEACGAVAAEFVLDGEKGVEQGLRGEIGFEGDNGVDKAGLGSKPDGLGAVEGGSGDDAAEGFEAVGSGGEGGLGRACRAGEICAQGDVGGVHEIKGIAEGDAQGEGWDTGVKTKRSVW
jgi:hypothetical protein